MKMIQITSLPQISFAHMFKADRYSNTFETIDNFLEVSYIVEGKAEIRTGNKKYIAKQGDVCCILYNKQTSISAEEYHCHHTCAAAVEWHPTDDTSKGLIIPPVTQASPNTEKICRIIDSIILHQTLSHEPSAKDSIDFLNILNIIDGCNKTIQHHSVPSDVLYVERAKVYISKHINEQIFQNEIANNLGISPGYLCNIFKKIEGMPLMQYVNKTKLENMRILMQREGIPLYEAAALFGYNDPNYVSRLHKKIFGYNITEHSLLFEKYFSL